MVVHGRTKFDKKFLDVKRLTSVLDVTRLTKKEVIAHFLYIHLRFLSLPTRSMMPQAKSPK